MVSSQVSATTQHKEERRGKQMKEGIRLNWIQTNTLNVSGPSQSSLRSANMNSLEADLEAPAYFGSSHF
jgi:hypothetical protein